MTTIGKISVTHFLNKNLKPVVQGKIKQYPLYVRIRFENKKTELKSKAFKFFYEPGDVAGLIDKLNSNEDLINLSEAEFLKMSSDYRLINERKAIFEIVAFYKQKKGINIISGKTAEIIENCLTSIYELVSHHIANNLKGSIYDSSSYIQAGRVIDWENHSFSRIFKALEKISGDQFYKAILSKYVDWNTSVTHLQKFISQQKRTIWLYEWGDGPMRESLINSFKSLSNQGNYPDLIALIDKKHKEKFK